MDHAVGGAAAEVGHVQARRHPREDLEDVLELAAGVVGAEVADGPLAPREPRHEAGRPAEGRK